MADAKVYVFGGLSCMVAACFTNPADVIKVKYEFILLLWLGVVQSRRENSTTVYDQISKSVRTC